MNAAKYIIFLRQNWRKPWGSGFCDFCVFAIFCVFALFCVFGPPDHVRGAQTPENGSKRPFLTPFSPVFRHFSRDPVILSDYPHFFPKSAKRSGDLFCSTGSCELPISRISSDFASGARKMDFGGVETAVLARFWPFWGPKRRFRAFRALWPSKQ